MASLHPLGVELERITTAFNHVIARKVHERVDLEVEGATFATWHPTHLFTGYSWDALSAGCLLRAGGPPRSVLVLGLGGGTVVRQLRCLVPAVTMLAVEIDQGIVDLARRHMGLDELDVEVVVADAYEHLRTSATRYDAIIDDLFLTGPDDVMRSRTPAGVTLDLLRTRLAPGGVLVANLITDDGHRDVQRSTRRAFLDSFSCVRTVNPPRGLNEIVVGGDDVLPRSALDAYTARLAEPFDRERWRELEVVKLRRR